MNRGLVLGGGGITGIAWEIGIVFGLAESGVDLRAADVVVGTSAGSVVGALVRSELPLDAIYESQLQQETEPIGARMGLGVILRYVTAAGIGRHPHDIRRRIGRLALKVPGSEEERKRILAERVPLGGWPEGRLLITAVNAETGDPMVFDKSSGASLLDAVSASCAVPLVWPPITINGKRYMDGGARSIANADLASGCDRVVVIAPITAAFRKGGRISVQLQRLGPEVESTIVSPDRESRRAIGRQVLQPAGRAAAAEAGRRQGRLEAERVRSVWSGGNITAVEVDGRSPAAARSEESPGSAEQGAG
jgi:NTE family protein